MQQFENDNVLKLVAIYEEQLKKAKLKVYRCCNFSLYRKYE